MKVLVLSCNGEVIEVFDSVEKVGKFLKEEWFVEDFKLENVTLDFENGLRVLIERGYLELYDENLVERGDDYMELKVDVMEVN